ncbi:hypothetical protein [Rhizobium miluonense]|uniref:Type IV secretion system protein VirB7 n=1 Tax=Rhizobium miluonense TaxID=411945 RepID=A0A1C3V1K4_9HYPH|nr:hypothetical protein [Rhizobium miluonense]SCB21554.1 type IV secretion system protein VirB7 [Rhizobium miluonense]
MIRMLLSLLLTASLAGCSSISHPLPKCDGYSRRPLNRSMWQWQDNGKTDRSATGAVDPGPTNRAASFAEEPATTMPAAFAQFDIAGSYRPCEGK